MMDNSAESRPNTALIQSLHLKSFLSFGPEAEPIELRNLNVLIGPNGSGKSNLISALSLFKASATKLETAIREGGGISQWIWKGERHDETYQSTSIEATVFFPQGDFPLTHNLTLIQIGNSHQISAEIITDAGNKSDYYYFWGGGPGGANAIIKVRENAEAAEIGKRTVRDISPVDKTESVLLHRRDTDYYPEITYLGQVYPEIFLFRSLGFQSPLRGPQRADLPSGFLLEDASNLGLVLRGLLENEETKGVILPYLKKFYRFADEIQTKVERGVIDTYLHEFSYFIPSIRLSDGTLRFLCLAAILCHPEPPPLICIEDPEIGLHPDSLPIVADMLMQAAEKTQVIVTTQSDTLVSAFSSCPEAVMVCEKDERGTSIRRLEEAKLEAWLDEYSLGTLWRKGEIGGNP